MRLTFFLIFCLKLLNSCENQFNSNPVLQSKSDAHPVLNSTHSNKLIIDNNLGISITEESINIQVPGNLKYIFPFKEKFYGLIEIENSINSSSYTYSPLFRLVEIDKNGNVQYDDMDLDFMSKFEFFQKNDNLFLGAKDAESIYDLKKRKWIKNELNKENKIYEDERIRAFSEDFGEWGGFTWIQDKKSGIEYSLKGYYSDFKEFQNEYYLLNSYEIYKFSSLKDLDKTAINYSEYLSKGMNIYDQNGSYKGLTKIYRNDNNTGFGADLYLNGMFQFQNQLLIANYDQQNFYLAELKEEKLVPKVEFRNFQFKKIANNPEKLVMIDFFPESNLTVLMEFTEKGILRHDFINQYRQAVYSQTEISEWMDSEITFILKVLTHISIDEIVEKEKALETIEITPDKGNSKAMLDEIKEYDRRKIYRKKQELGINIISEYFYHSQSGKVGAVAYTWESKSENHSFEFNYWFNKISKKYGEPRLVDKSENRSNYYWEIGKDRGIKIKYSLKELSLTIYSK
jgi:hypothetical protein